HAGGREAMLSDIRYQVNHLNFTYGPSHVDSPTEIVSAGNQQYVVIPFSVDVVGVVKLRVNSFLIGVSSDQGRTWAFINGVVSLRAIQAMFPNFPPGLKLPPDRQWGERNFTLAPLIRL